MKDSYSSKSDFANSEVRVSELLVLQRALLAEFGANAGLPGKRSGSNMAAC